MVLGVVPTVLAVLGWLVLLARSLNGRRPERLGVALLPLAGIAGYLYFTVSYPTPDGDVLKPTYMLSTLGAWALCFGFLADRLGGRSRWLLAATALLMLPFVDDKVPAKFKLSSPDKEVSVAIVSWFGSLEVRPEVMPADGELSDRLAKKLKSNEKPINVGRLMGELNALMPQDAILVADGGFAGHWGGLLFDTKRAGRHFIADRGFASFG